MSAKGWRLADVLLDDAKNKELIDLSRDRLRASSDYYRPRLDVMIRCWKIYRAIVDATDKEDESNVGPHYAFGIIEDAVAAVSESILNSRVPTPAKPKKAGDDKAAENFNAMASTYFATGQYQEHYPGSVRERAICGANWENDRWNCRYQKAQRWERQQVPDQAADGSAIVRDDYRTAPYQEEVSFGYETRFPSILLMRPQPRIDSPDKMRWLNEIEENADLETLAEQHYIDPASKAKVPLFNLDAIQKEIASTGKIIRPTQLGEGTDWQLELRGVLEKRSDQSDAAFEDKTHQLRLDWNWEPDRMWCVANGQWIISYVENLFHRPRIPYRLKNWTPQKHSLYGVGLIEPVEALYMELDDIHRLSIRNWQRIIHRMIAYNPDTVPYADLDFKRKAMGRIRVRPELGGSVQSQIASLETSDVSGSMLAQESNNKGLLERALGRPDYSPGVEGTKQDHKTLGGLDKIERNVDKRTAAVRRQELAGFQRQMSAMEAMASQFLIERKSFTVYNADGSTHLADFNLWDIDTQGRGFNYLIEYDPAAGDDAMARHQSMQLMGHAIEYNQAELAVKGPMAVLVELPEIMRRTLKLSGFNDTAAILKRPDGVRSPQDEMQAMLRGEPVQVNPLEDLVAHYVGHLKDFNDPALKEAIKSGAVAPEVMLQLQGHIMATGQAIQEALRNPQGLMQARSMAQAMIAGGQAGPAAPGRGPAPVRPGRPVASNGGGPGGPVG